MVLNRMRWLFFFQILPCFWTIKDPSRLVYYEPSPGERSQPHGSARRQPYLAHLQVETYSDSYIDRKSYNIMLSLGVICDTGIYTVKKPIYTEGAYNT